MNFETSCIAAAALALASCSSAFAAPIPASKFAAITASANGLDFLLSHQNADGSFGSNDVDTAAAVIAISNMHTDVQTYPLGPIPLPFGGGFGLGLANPFYRPQAQTAVDRADQNLWLHARVTPISSQPYGDPDVDRSGVGAYWSKAPGPNEFDSVASTAFIARALGAYAHGANVISGGVLAGKSFEMGAQEIIDWFGYGQVDFGSGRGGWYFDANDANAEMSLTGLVVQGLQALEDNFYTTVPSFVRREISHFISNVYDPSTGSYGNFGPILFPSALTDALGISAQRFLGNSASAYQRTLDCIRGACANASPLLTTYSQVFGNDIDNLASVEAYQNIIATALIAPQPDLPDVGLLEDSLAGQLLPLQNADGSWDPRSIGGGFPTVGSVIRATAYNIDSLGDGRFVSQANFSATDTATVPEPSSIVLVVISLAAGISVIRRPGRARNS